MKKSYSLPSILLCLSVRKKDLKKENYHISFNNNNNHFHNLSSKTWKFRQPRLITTATPFLSYMKRNKKEKVILNNCVINLFLNFIYLLRNHPPQHHLVCVRARISIFFPPPSLEWISQPWSSSICCCCSASSCVSWKVGKAVQQPTKFYFFYEWQKKEKSKKRRKRRSRLHFTWRWQI